MPENTPGLLAQLRRLVETGEVGDGGQLPTERVLAERFGVGRRALRAALEVLEEEGLIWRQQGKGTFIGQRPDPTGIIAAQMVEAVNGAAVMEARLCIEPELAALCALRATPEDIERMERLNEHLRMSADAGAAELWDGALHRLIAKAAGNPVLLTSFQILDEVRVRDDWQALQARARSPAAIHDTDRDHSAIVLAIKARDPARARAAMVTHLERLAGNLTRSMSQAEAAE